MALHDDLLTLARDLVDRDPGAPSEAGFRRAVSTAYYALFHLLIHESTARLVAVASLRPRVARSFDHRIMSTVCKEYGRSAPNPAGGSVTATGRVIPRPLWEVASAFVLLQDARHQADYDTATPMTHAEADTEVTRAEVAFLDWDAIRADPAADAFLVELLFRGLPRR